MKYNYYNTLSFTFGTSLMLFYVGYAFFYPIRDTFGLYDTKHITL